MWVAATQFARRRSLPSEADRYSSVPPSPCGRKLARPVEDCGVGRGAFARELREVGKQVGAESRDRVGLALEARQPDTVAPQDVIERPVHGAEEGTGIARAFHDAEFADDRVHPFVHPVVVAGEKLAILDGDHAKL
jgi:hypothetical protein